jgi:HSP20 family protein
MSLVRWEPVRRSELDRLFGAFFDVSAANGGSTRRFVPATDLVEAGDHYVLTADLPGVAQDDIKIELNDNVLTVAGERRSEHTTEGDGYRRLERSSGRFSRSLTLPEGIDPESISASYDNGVLRVEIPKPTQRVPHRVEVTVGAPQAIEAATEDEADKS